MTIFAVNMLQNSCLPMLLCLLQMLSLVFQLRGDWVSLLFPSWWRSTRCMMRRDQGRRGREAWACLVACTARRREINIYPQPPNLLIRLLISRADVWHFIAWFAIAHPQDPCPLRAFLLHPSGPVKHPRKGTPPTISQTLRVLVATGRSLTLWTPLPYMTSKNILFRQHPRTALVMTLQKASLKSRDIPFRQHQRRAWKMSLLKAYLKFWGHLVGKNLRTSMKMSITKTQLKLRNHPIRKHPWTDFMMSLLKATMNSRDLLFSSHPRRAVTMSSLKAYPGEKSRTGGGKPSSSTGFFIDTTVSKSTSHGLTSVAFFSEWNVPKFNSNLPIN